MTEGQYGREAPQPGERRPPDSGPFVVFFVRNQEQMCDTVEPDTDRLGSIATVQRFALPQGMTIADHLEPHTTSAFVYFVVPAYLREAFVAGHPGPGTRPTSQGRAGACRVKDQGPAPTLDTTRGFAARKRGRVCVASRGTARGTINPNETFFIAALSSTGPGDMRRTCWPWTVHERLTYWMTPRNGLRYLSAGNHISYQSPT